MNKNLNFAKFCINPFILQINYLSCRLFATLNQPCYLRKHLFIHTQVLETHLFLGVSSELAAGVRWALYLFFDWMGEKYEKDEHHPDFVLIYLLHSQETQLKNRILFTLVPTEWVLAGKERTEMYEKNSQCSALCNFYQMLSFLWKCHTRAPNLRKILFLCYFTQFSVWFFWQNNRWSFIYPFFFFCTLMTLQAQRFSGFLNNSRQFTSLVQELICLSTSISPLP